jgi:flavin reductase (DIM6/NTAB) family NADH-FMN oxidoreductase RutF
MKQILSQTMMSQAGPPMSVVMATCIDSNGKPNIITLGMYMPISSNPRLVCIGVAPRRYSHDLIINSGEFVVNVPSLDLEEEMHYCGTKSGRDYNKFEELGLTPIPAKKVKSPLIKECFGHLECKVVDTRTYGDHTLIVGEVISATINEEVLTDGKLDLIKARPIISKNRIYHTVTNP